MSSASFPFTSSEPTACLATCLLACSIQNNRFPALRKIRAPHDPQGLLQALCKPLATALLPADTAILASSLHSKTPSPSSLASSDQLSSYPFPEMVKPGSGAPPETRVDSPMTANFPSSERVQSLFESPYTAPITPAHSRIAAQARILEGRRQPSMIVQVTDPQGELRVNKTVLWIHGPAR